MLVHRIKQFIESLEIKADVDDLKLLTLLKSKYQNISSKELNHRTKQFIESTSEIKPILNEEALSFLTQLVIKDQNASPENLNLDKADFVWLEELFAARWDIVARKPNDYTYRTDGVNAHWISLAKDLAVELNKPYLLILMPTLTNRLDPNNFSRLNDASDPRCIYISADNKIWHRVSALYAQLQKGVCGIFENLKYLRLRPLTAYELYSLLQKRGTDLAFKCEKTGKSYANIWDYLKRKVAPTWHIHGLSITYLLPDMLKIVEDFFDGKDLDNDFSSFHASCKIFFNNLVKNPLAEVNHFYGARIKVNKSRFFLFEILVDCLQENKQGLTEKLLGVAKWIAKTDPSLISKNTHLNPIYARLKIGEYFDLKAIRKSVISLNIADTESYKPLQKQVLQSLDNALTNPAVNVEETRVAIIKLITEIFHMRGEEVIDTKFDYTRYLQKKANFPWLQFALKLAGAKDIDYYHALLIPSLNQKNYDFITLGPFSDHALSKCILSSDRKLIYLPHCKSYYKANGLFYKFVDLEPEPLTTEEIQRLAFAAPAMYKLFCHINTNSQKASISKRTINELRQLVNGSLNPAGIEEELEGEDENAAAQTAYDNFALYLSSLPKEEKNNFLQYKVSFSNRRITYRQIFGRVQAYDPEWRGCATQYAAFIAQGVMDHAPYTKFISAIEENVSISVMRATSAKKVYSDYDHLTDAEAVKRILTLITSLMTHSFDTWLLGTTLTLGNYENKVDSSGKEIFDLVKRNIERGDFRHARFLYVQLIEHLVPSFVKTTWTKDTSSWLSSIQNESIFSPENATCFDPELILFVLWPIAQKNKKIQSVCESFLQNLHEILSSSDNQYKKWVLVNIGFSKLLKDPALSEDKMAIIINLRVATAKISIPIQNSQWGEHFIFGKDTYFDPELIITILWPIAQKNSAIKRACDTFLDNLHKIQFSSDRRHKKWLRVNVEFSKFLEDPPVCDYSSTILAELRLMKEKPLSPEQVLQASKDFLIHRLAQLGSQTVSSRQVGLFGCPPGQNTVNYAEFKKLLNEKYENTLLLQNTCLSSSDLLVKLDQTLMKIDKKESPKLKDYLKRFIPQKNDISLEDSPFFSKLAFG